MHVSDPTGLGYGCEGPPVGKVPSASKQEQTAHTTGIQPKRTEEARAASLSSRCQVSSVVTSSIVVCGGRSGPAEVGRAPLCLTARWLVSGQKREARSHGSALLFAGGLAVLWLGPHAASARPMIIFRAGVTFFSLSLEILHGIRPF